MKTHTKITLIILIGLLPFFLTSCGPSDEEAWGNDKISVINDYVESENFEKSETDNLHDYASYLEHLDINKNNLDELLIAFKDFSSKNKIVIDTVPYAVYSNLFFGLEYGYFIRKYYVPIDAKKKVMEFGMEPEVHIGEYYENMVGPYQLLFIDGGNVFEKGFHVAANNSVTERFFSNSTPAPMDNSFYDHYLKTGQLRHKVIKQYQYNSDDVHIYVDEGDIIEKFQDDIIEVEKYNEQGELESKGCYSFGKLEYYSDASAGTYYSLFGETITLDTSHNTHQTDTNYLEFDEYEFALQVEEIQKKYTTYGNRFTAFVVLASTKEKEGGNSSVSCDFGCNGSGKIADNYAGGTKTCPGCAGTGSRKRAGTWKTFQYKYLWVEGDVGYEGDIGLWYIVNLETGRGFRRSNKTSYTPIDFSGFLNLINQSINEAL